VREGVDFMSTLVGKREALGERLAGFRSEASIRLFDDPKVHLERYEFLGSRLAEFESDVTPVLFLEVPDVLGGPASFRAFATRHIGHDALSAACSVSQNCIDQDGNANRIAICEEYL